MFFRYLLVKILNICYRGSVGGLLKCQLVHSTSLILVKWTKSTLTLHLLGVIIISKTEQQMMVRMWRIVTSYIAGGNTYIIATLGSSLAILQKVKVSLAILLLGALKITCSCKKIYMNVYSSIIHNSQKLETVKMSIIGQIGLFILWNIIIQQ